MADKKSTTLGLAENIISALCYVPVVGWIFAVVVLVVEKDAGVKWNAWQSVLFGALAFITGLAFASTIILAFLLPIVNIAALVINLILAVKAYNKESLRLPVIADWADKIVKKA